MKTAKPSREALRASIPLARKMASVVDRRAANNRKRPKGTGFNSRVTDNDPMTKDSESNWP